MECTIIHLGCVTIEGNKDYARDMTNEWRGSDKNGFVPCFLLPRVIFILCRKAAQLHLASISSVSYLYRQI